MRIRTLAKVGLSLLLLAIVLVGISYSMLRTKGVVNPTSTAGSVLRTENREIGQGVSSVELIGPIDLTLRQGNVPSLKVKGEQRRLGNVETVQEGSRLRIGITGVLLYHRRPLQVELVLPSINELEIHGNGDSTVSGFSGERLSVQLHGAGNLSFTGRYRHIDGGLHGSGGMNLNTGGSERVVLELTGSGSINSSGNCKALSVDLTGSGSLDAEHMASDVVQVALKGSGNTKVFARQVAEVEIDGSGEVTVFGNPDQRRVSRNGNGTVEWAH
ncbi:GIN domain-containing protein [Massilia endophytica]|uniref:GIN domain-containing protein n=1 Tax=Massilia endophytica TaxID=2899220 RepID=UPI001E570A10|nr:DUF2807 domain-containing protein [Massilia endophytica]UGQ48508.1 DUF2807 domain-containing protein [Massilia endophytica]